MIEGCWPDNRWSDVLSTVQQCACGRGYLHAADGSSFCTRPMGAVVQMIRCTDNGRLVYSAATDVDDMLCRGA